MSFNHWELFDAVATAIPDRIALIHGNIRLTYNDLRERSIKLATYLCEKGVKKPQQALNGWESGQDHVGLYLYNGNEYIEGTFGSYATRAAPFNINYKYTSDELAYLLNDAKPFAIIFHSSFSNTLSEALKHIKIKPLLLCVKENNNDILIDGAVDYEDALLSITNTYPTFLEENVGKPDPSDLYILYTGGTTGMPKGTLWYQKDIYEVSMKVFAARLGVAPISIEAIANGAVNASRAVSMPLPPFMHGASQWVALGNLLAGFTIALPDDVKRFDAADFWRTVEREKVESTVIVGDAFARPLCEELEKNHYDTSSLVFIATGGAITTKDVKARLLKNLPNIIIADVGGSSESGAILTNISRNGSEVDTGKFFPNPGTIVVDEAFQHILDKGHDGIGWLAKTSPIPLGYLNDQEKSMKTFIKVGGERVAILGDRARLLENGQVELLGRESVTINTGGEKVFAEEVETALVSHPEIVDAIVVGIPSERWGSQVCAVIELYENSSVTDNEIVKFLSCSLAKFKVPKKIVRVHKVKRSAAGKADYAWAHKISNE